MHTDTEDIRRKARYRAELTRTVQNMMVEIWMEHRASDGTEYSDDPTDIQIMHDQYQASLHTWVDYDDCDYDPWAPVNVPVKDNVSSAVEVKPNDDREN